MDERERPDPGREFWDGYWERLTARRKKEASRVRPAAHWREGVRPAGPRPPPLVLPGRPPPSLLSAPGFSSGGCLFRPRALPWRGLVEKRGALLLRRQGGGPAARARDYFDRSKLVIMALVNYNPATEDAYALDLPLQKEDIARAR